MKIRTLATVIAAALLTVALAPASSAQDNNSAADGIEVITITAKRPAPTVASACVNEVMARTAATVGSERGDGNFSGTAADGLRAGTHNLRQAIRHCIEQATTGAASG